MLTRIFKSGNSLAVHILKELGFNLSAQDVEIKHKGDALIIRPINKHSLGGVLDAFAAFPPNFMSEGRETHEQQERDWIKGD